jgi:4-hydroxy-tetrahydrodipicolinate reductase
MCQAAALLAACYLAHWEIIDYASDARTDVPSGTARELAERLGEIRQPEVGYTLRELHGPKEARGVAVGGAQIHSLRLPSFVVSTEVVFARPDERLTIRHDAGARPGRTSRAAARGAQGARVGVTRGLDNLLLGVT